MCKNWVCRGHPDGYWEVYVGDVKVLWVEHSYEAERIVEAMNALDWAKGSRCQYRYCSVNPATFKYVDTGHGMWLHTTVNESGCTAYEICTHKRPNDH